MKIIDGANPGENPEQRLRLNVRCIRWNGPIISPKKRISESSLYSDAKRAENYERIS
jgi:hypothetical protein